MIILCKKCKTELNKNRLCPKCHKWKIEEMESKKVNKRSFHPSSYSDKWEKSKQLTFETFPDDESVYCERCYDIFGTKNETKNLQVNHNIPVADVNDIVNEQDEYKKYKMIVAMKRRAREKLGIEIEDVTELYWDRRNLSILCKECNTTLGRKKMDFKPLKIKEKLDYNL